MILVKITKLWYLLLNFSSKSNLIMLKKKFSLTMIHPQIPSNKLVMEVLVCSYKYLKIVRTNYHKKKNLKYKFQVPKSNNSF